PESGLNAFIARYLLFVLASRGLVPLKLIVTHNCEVQVPILQPGDAANRYPDLVVLRQEHWDLTQTRLTITLEMPPPRWVVEVVSPGKVNRENDYTHKRAQYAARGIPEYWIIDPQQQLVTVLRLEDKRYVKTEFRGSDRIVSPTFPELELSAQDILKAAMGQ
ncbi:MAG: Uma2 family endonuclease, partial [Cyanobacteriota bacterium]|nr:Uma2 family endonuclease [Cyanobacteriota bacterium]